MNLHSRLLNRTLDLITPSSIAQGFITSIGQSSRHIDKMDFNPFNTTSNALLLQAGNELLSLLDPNADESETQDLSALSTTSIPHGLPRQTTQLLDSLLAARDAFKNFTRKDVWDLNNHGTFHSDKVNLVEKLERLEKSLNQANAVYLTHCRVQDFTDHFERAKSSRHVRHDVDFLRTAQQLAEGIMQSSGAYTSLNSGIWQQLRSRVGSTVLDNVEQVTAQALNRLPSLSFASNIYPGYTSAIHQQGSAKWLVAAGSQLSNLVVDQESRMLPWDQASMDVFLNTAYVHSSTFNDTAGSALPTIPTHNHFGSTVTASDFGHHANLDDDDVPPPPYTTSDSSQAYLQLLEPRQILHSHQGDFLSNASQNPYNHPHNSFPALAPPSYDASHPQASSRHHTYTSTGLHPTQLRPPNPQQPHLQRHYGHVTPQQRLTISHHSQLSHDHSHAPQILSAPFRQSRSGIPDDEDMTHYAGPNLSVYSYGDN